MPSSASASVGVLVGSGQPLNQHEAPASSGSVGAVNKAASSLEAARGGSSAKDQRSTSYRLIVKNNRIRPALGERVRLELQVADYGRVRIRLFDSQSRFLKDLADVSDLMGPLSVDWDGRLADGRDAPSGAYSILVQSPGKTEKVGILVIR
jgi:flagellar hook assembly protein FlgD